MRVHLPKPAWWQRLEAFEWVGLIASVAACVIFLQYGSRLDQLIGVPNYHWHVVLVVVSIYAHFIPWAIFLGSLLFVALAVWLRSRARELLGRYGFALRMFLAYCLLLIVFRIVNFYVPVLHPGIRDAALQKMDASIFGRQVAEWFAPVAHPWVTHIFTAAYVSWFWLLFATILTLVFVSREVASEYLLASLMAFYIGYVVYVMVPVVGPGYTVHYGFAVGDIAPKFTSDTLLISRDCFPSLHTAISVLMAIYIWRYRRSFAWLYIPLASLIILATLYLRWHYASDDIAGAALAVVCAYVAPGLYRYWEQIRTSRRHAQPSA